MVIEHTFITTLDCHNAMTLAAGFLQERGFQPVATHGFAINQGEWTELDMVRGKKNATRASSPTQCPQQLKLHFDRGRITVAASITPGVNQRSFAVDGIVLPSFVANQGYSKKTHAYAELMLKIATALELLLASGHSPEDAARDWQAYEANLQRVTKRNRNRMWIVFAIFILVMAVIISAAILFSH